jgi:ribosomal protein L11 methyltransferase
MEWIENKIVTTSDGVEPLTGMLMEHGIQNTQIKDEAENRRFLRDNPQQWDYIDEGLTNQPVAPVSVIFYVANNPAGMEMLENVKSGLRWLKDQEIGIDLGELSLSSGVKDDEVWLNAWKKYFKPLRIGKNLVIRPDWEPYVVKPGETMLTINPGHVFGTGLHQTTQLCLEQLEKRVKPGSTALDLGCGSGILSIAALLLGAAHAYGCDFDPGAEQTAYQNARLNHIPKGRYTVATGNLITDENLRRQMNSWPKADIVLANIVADAVIALLDLAKQCMKPDGTLIASGIIFERLDDVTTAMGQHEYAIDEIQSKDDWYCVVAHHA